MSKEEMINVLHINCNYITRSLHQTMIEHLDKYTNNLIFVPTYDSKKAVITPNRNVVVSECFDKWDRIVFDYKQRKIINSIKKTCNVKKHSIIHAHTLFTDGNVALKLHKQFCIPYIVAVRNTDLNVFLKKLWFLRKRGIEILLNASAVIFLSPTYKKQLFDEYIPNEYKNGIDKKSIIIPNGIDDFWIESLNSQKDYNEVEKRIKAKELRIIFVGQIDRNKNVDTILEAVSLINQQGWNVAFNSVGKIEDKEIYDRLQKHDAFMHTDPVPKEELIAYYRNADLFVMPSHTESFGLVYAEAMSQGLPVLYTRGQGFDGQFPDGEVGFAVSDTDPKELADKIMLCYQNYKQLSQNSLDKVDRFRWDSICVSYKDIYQKILSGIYVE